MVQTTAREEALARFRKAKARKRETVERVVASMKESYEKKTGLKANYVFVM